MPNMSYCRFQNTLLDLYDCADYITDNTLSKEEEKAREKLVDLCRSIVEEWDYINDEESNG